MILRQGLIRFLSSLGQKQRRNLPDVIYLGCDTRDNVGSMRAVMLERARRGELNTL